MSEPLNIAMVNAADVGSGAERAVMTMHVAFRRLGHNCTTFVGSKMLDVAGVVEIPYVRGPRGTRRIARLLERAFGWQDIYNPSFRALPSLVPAGTHVVQFYNLWGTAGFADIGVLPRLTALRPGILTEEQAWFLSGRCAYFHECLRWRDGCGHCPRPDLSPVLPHDGTARNWRRKRRTVQRSNLAFVGVSDWVAGCARQCGIWEGKRILRIYNGLDLATFRASLPACRESTRLQLGVAPDQIAILLTGQTLEGRRLGIATEGIEAVKELSDLRILPVLVGPSSQEVAASLGRPALALPYRATPEEMAACYRAMDMTLVTSKVEAFGLIAAESQACGTPVVALDACALPEVTRDGIGGIIVRHRSVSGLVDAIRTLARDASLRRRLGEGGQRFVAEAFADDVIAREYIALYRDEVDRFHARQARRP